MIRMDYAGIKADIMCFFNTLPLMWKADWKFWGHYTSEDLVDWKYEGTALYPDSPYDCHGVYSGSHCRGVKTSFVFHPGKLKIDLVIMLY